MSEVVLGCDNKSVGVIIENEHGSIALLKRARFPVGIAPPAGHVDNHGSPEQAAVNEVNEELGLIVAIGGLHRTAIEARTINNPCRRIGGDHHEWWVYQVNQFEGELTPSPDEAKSAGWYTRPGLQELADRTKAFQLGQIPQEEWEANPGIEGVWLGLLTELDYVR